jgi:hypothetical protein
MKLDTVSITPPLPWVNSRILTGHEQVAAEEAQGAFVFYCKNVWAYRSTCVQPMILNRAQSES